MNEEEVQTSWDSVYDENETAFSTRDEDDDGALSEDSGSSKFPGPFGDLEKMEVNDMTVFSKTHSSWLVLLPFHRTLRRLRFELQ